MLACTPRCKHRTLLNAVSSVLRLRVFLVLKFARVWSIAYQAQALDVNATPSNLFSDIPSTPPPSPRPQKNK